MAKRKAIGWLFLAALAAAMAGCDALEGRPTQPGLYKLPKGKSVLVLVDVREGVPSPPAFTTNLADRIGADLFTNKAVEKLVPQDQIVTLRQRDPAKFGAMNTDEVARATDADIVVRVYLTALQTQLSVDGSVVWGDATAYVKVIARDGQKLWPGQATGAPVVARVNEVQIEDRDVPRVLKDLSDQLATNIGRIFHEWKPQSGEMLPR